MKQVYINAYESISCAGTTKELMGAVYDCRPGIHIDETYMPGNPVALGSFAPREFFESLESVVAAVLEQSNLDDFSDTLLLVGSSVGGIAKSEQIYFAEGSFANINPDEHAISVISDTLQARFGFAGARSFSTACTSSANAMMVARRLLRLGAYDSVLVVGADALCYTTVCGFYALSVLSSKPCTPFQEGREGMNVAEGVAALLLQTEPVAGSIAFCGASGSSDAFHITNPDPEAKGAIACMEAALKDAGITPDQVGYVNAHGTGTQANDAAEGTAIAALMPHRPYVSSTKAITGHTLGAAGALEAIICCELLKDQKVAPQSSLETAENPELNLSREPRETVLRYVLSNSFAFGGNNTALVFGVRS
jgi:3-oxoacyl-[acyl-carrier-protein] synthase I